MSYSKISYSSRVHRTDIKYEHIIRSGRGKSMANDTNPDVQQDNRLKQQLAAIDRQKMQILRKLGSDRTRSFPRITARSKDPAFAQDRLNRTLKKYGMELPQLKKCQTAPDLYRSNEFSPDVVREGKGSPRQWLKKTMSSPAKKIYSVLYEADSYSAFCDRLRPLHEQNKAMKEDIQSKISNRAMKGEIISRSKLEEETSCFSTASSSSTFTSLDLCPTSSLDSSAASVHVTSPLQDSSAAPLQDSSAASLREHSMADLRESPAVCLRYCDDMSSYLLEHSRLYNFSVAREDQEELHNWEAYRRSCPVGNVTFVKGPDILQLSYLSFHWCVVGWCLFCVSFLSCIVLFVVTDF